jgi:hypothetical protein
MSLLVQKTQSSVSHSHEIFSFTYVFGDLKGKKRFLLKVIFLLFAVEVLRVRPRQPL